MNDRIENYFNQDLSPPERAQFEEELRRNPELQEESAFYLKTKELLREQTLAGRHAEWQKSSPTDVPVRRLSLWQYATAAVIVLGLGLAWLWLSGTKELTWSQLAQDYIEQEFTNLPTQMGGEADSLQIATDLYNKGKFPAAQSLSETMLERNPDDALALKLAGLSALRQADYDLAITYFNRLSAQPDLYANPGKFYEAIAHLQRNRPLDKKKSEELLNAVISGDLPGKAEAEQWLAAKAE